MSDAESRVGRRIGDRFVVEEVLGAGGMGSIHRARDERLGEQVAIKFLRRALADDAVTRERFRREAVSLACLRHPGIVAVLDFGEADGDLYIVLELVNGHTLERVLGTPLSLFRAAPIFDQLLAALEVCHANGVVHRDIKPSNVMVSSAPERVTLIDFGLARIGGDAGASPLGKLTDTGAVQGTPHYMAPEQCRGEEVGPPADVYATGMILYEALAGKAPFAGDNAAVFMAQHLFASPAPLREVAPQVTPGLAAAVHRALAKPPGDRPTAGELRAALASAFAGTDPEALAERAAKGRQRAAGLPRSERAITGRPAPHSEPVGGTVTIWMANDARSAELRGCLGTAGLECALWTGDGPPLAGDVVIASARDGIARGAIGRPVILVDVGGPDETTAAIRAGAADMLLAGAPAADLVGKVQRLLRRRRRT